LVDVGQWITYDSKTRGHEEDSCDRAQRMLGDDPSVGGHYHG
jgi:hypothetical protein